mmetsp:Transcript_12343/g.23133  ORF Transcript_12343/g.23133 Transcript_12343/m.23133 type:complete len:136 (-) Transcript_12343:1304-1711(-)
MKKWQEKFYTQTRLFTLAPEVYPLFSFSKDYDILSDEMFEAPKFKKHAAGVIRTIDKTVQMLQNSNISEFVDVLGKLGKRHIKYGVVEAHYPVLGNAVFQTLEEAIGDGFTPEVKEGWVEVWGVISKAMIEGAAN